MGLNNFLTWHCNMDSEGHDSFEAWKETHPYGTLDDWWDIQAYKKSGGALPNPLDDPSVAYRLRQR